MTFRERWMSYSPRERKFLSIGAIVLMVLLIYVILWEPLANSVQKKEQYLVRQQKLLNWMRQNATQAEEFRTKKNKPISSDALLNLINQDFNRHSFKARLSLENDGTIKVILKNVSFDRFSYWLSGFDRRVRFDILNLQVTRLKKPGMGDIQMQVKA